MVAWTDLWVYNAKNFRVSLFNQIASIFHLGGGKIKKVFLGLPIEDVPNYDKDNNESY